MNASEFVNLEVLQNGRTVSEKHVISYLDATALLLRFVSAPENTRARITGTSATGMVIMHTGLLEYPLVDSAQRRIGAATDNRYLFTPIEGKEGEESFADFKSRAKDMIPGLLSLVPSAAPPE